jgi:cell division septation protein DedD
VVVIRCDGDFEYESFSLEAPERFVVDLAGVAKEPALSVVPGNIHPVIQVRMAQFRSLPRPISRVIVDLEEPAAASVERVSGGLALRLEPLVTPAAAEAVEDPTQPEEASGPSLATGPTAALETAFSGPTPAAGAETPEPPVPVPEPTTGSAALSAAGDTPPTEARSLATPVAEPPEPDLPSAPPESSAARERTPAPDEPEGLPERADDVAEDSVSILSEQRAGELLPVDSESRAEAVSPPKTAPSTETRPSPATSSDPPEVAPASVPAESSVAPERDHLAAGDTPTIVPEQPVAELLPAETDSRGETEDEPAALPSAEQKPAPLPPTEDPAGDLPSNLSSPTPPERAETPVDPSRLFERHTRPKETLEDYLRRRRGERSPMAAPSRPTSAMSTTSHKSAYLLQVVASSNRAEAERWRSTLDAAGYRAFVSILNLPTGVVHRVLLVGFENREEARLAAERIREKHRIPVAILRVPSKRENPATE